MSEITILQQLRTLWRRLCVTLMPIIRRRRQPPNVLRFFQIDSAVSRLFWIDIHDVGYCPFACAKDMNPDFHAHAQCDGCKNQGAMKVDDERFAFACQKLAHTKRLDPNLKANPRAPSRFTNSRIGSHTVYPTQIEHTLSRATVTSLPRVVCDFKHNERYQDVSTAPRWRPELNDVLAFGNLSGMGMLRRMRLQSLFGFANNRHVWQQGSTLCACLSESLKVYRQQRKWFTRVTVMQWNHQRRLVFAVTATWLGWFCERCCWHVIWGTEPTPQQGTANAQEQFDAHE
jgi:hypothetical protein